MTVQSLVTYLNGKVEIYIQISYDAEMPDYSGYVKFPVEYTPYVRAAFAWAIDPRAKSMMIYGDEYVMSIMSGKIAIVEKDNAIKEENLVPVSVEWIISIIKILTEIIDDKRIQMPPLSTSRLNAMNLITIT